jgi:hypothetical protein
MNFEKHFEKLLTQELENKDILIKIDKDAYVYAGFLIKKNKNQKWAISKHNTDIIDCFSLRFSAISAVYYYKNSNFKKYNELKILDQYYEKHWTDSEMYQQRSNMTRDYAAFDLYQARFTESKNNLAYVREEMFKKFKINF